MVWAVGSWSPNHRVQTVVTVSVDSGVTTQQIENSTHLPILLILSNSATPWWLSIKLYKRVVAILIQSTALPFYPAQCTASSLWKEVLQDSGRQHTLPNLRQILAWALQLCFGPVSCCTALFALKLTVWHRLTSYSWSSRLFMSFCLTLTLMER